MKTRWRDGSNEASDEVLAFEEHSGWCTSLTDASFGGFEIEGACGSYFLSAADICAAELDASPTGVTQHNVVD